MKQLSITLIFWLLLSCICHAQPEAGEWTAANPQIVRGESNVVIDSIGNIVSIPAKIILLNPKIENHKISLKTEKYIADFVSEHPREMNNVKIRINQCSPLGELDRLTKNRQISFWWRIFPGIPTTLWASLTGRVLGGDNYNPFTNTISLYSDDPSVALHEANHARDFMSRISGVESDAYAVGRVFTPVALYQEFTASDETLEYLKKKEDIKEELHGYSTLYPAYGTYVGSASGLPYGNVGGAFVGHGVGLWKKRERRLYANYISYGEICKNLESDPLAKNLLGNYRENNAELNKNLQVVQIKWE